METASTSISRNSSDIKQWAATLINNHQNPLKKFESPGSKLFLPRDNEKEQELVNNSLESIQRPLSYERVDRRCARSVANWLTEQNLAEVTKIVGSLSNYGFANKSGKYLYPEEALFLLETNRLELLHNQIPLSIQEAYNILLGKSKYSLRRFLTFKKIAIEGFRIAPYSPNIDQLPKRIKLNNESKSLTLKPPRCKLKKGLGKEKNDKIESSSSESLKNIFAKLQESGPKQIKSKGTFEPDYEVFVPLNSNTSKLNLYILEEDVLPSNIGFLNQELPSLVSFSQSEASSYFCFGNVELPNLI